MTGHLHLNADPYKMSKSRFNTVEVTELLEQYTANQFRLMCLMEQYYKRTFQILVPNSFYRPHTEYGEGNVFTRVSHCIHGEGIDLPLPGMHHWSHDQREVCPLDGVGVVGGLPSEGVCIKVKYVFAVGAKEQGSHSDWKTWKNGKEFSSQGKVSEF